MFYDLLKFTNHNYITVWGNWCSIVLTSLSDHKYLTF